MEYAALGMFGEEFTIDKDNKPTTDKHLCTSVNTYMSWINYIQT